MTMNSHLHTLTGAYAMNALDADEQAAFEAHLPDCESCREELEGFVVTTALLGGAVAETPPAHLKGAVVDAVARTRQEPPTVPATPQDRSTHPTRGRRRAAGRTWTSRLLVPAAAAMAIIVAGLSIVVGNLNRRLDDMATPREVAAVVAAEDMQTWDADLPGGGSARVVYSATHGQGWFLADGLDDIDPSKTYELWLIDDQGPAPAGLFRPSDGVAAHAFTGDVSNVAAIGVTVEPASGSSQPTTDPVVVVEK